MKVNSKFHMALMSASMEKYFNQIFAKLDLLQIESNNEKVGNSKKSNYLIIRKSLLIFVTLSTWPLHLLSLKLISGVCSYEGPHICNLFFFLEVEKGTNFRNDAIFW